MPSHKYLELLEVSVQNKCRLHEVRCSFRKLELFAKY